MNRETLRNKLNEVEQEVKWYRPDDTMRFKYGLPEDDIVVHGISAQQWTLDAWFDFKEDEKMEIYDVWDFDITIRTSLLIEETVAEIVKLVLAELPSSSP